MTKFVFDEAHNRHEGYSKSETDAAINASANVTNLAPVYDSTQTYNTGDMVIYDNILYVCNADNTTGTWNASKWIQTNVAGQTAAIKNSLNNKLNKGTQFGVQDFINQCLFNMGYTGDLNNAATYGISFVSGNNLTNAPSSDYYFVISVSQNGNKNFANQLAFRIQNNSLYVRNCSNGTWGAWRTI